MNRIPFGLQLYCVRDDCARDLPGTLSAIARMGYQGVEFAGYHGYSAKDLWRMLNDAGLQCCGSHLRLKDLEGDALLRTVEFNHTLGNRFLIVASLPPDRVATRTDWLAHAELFSELSVRLASDRLRLGYHNHDREFRTVEGEQPWETFFAHTAPTVVMQLDTGNALHGGGDPAAILRRFPGRATTIHFKEYAGGHGKAIIGEGPTDFRALMDLCEQAGGTEWYIVEQESDEYPPLECARRCLETLRRY
ncbi:MAG: sugar phosphate isomerase/epimerase family protein [Anaerolineae bacterium]